ncbi:MULTISPECIES: lipoprotein-releasing ABC transporter ATP-binding protein LolD [Thiomicrorhabdus]|uniref:Lipoprotein-releasing system ATP-binding protein LolD n=1 Tax=Thiomicrorhabdus heinhorstiae TaxID=2748010 RepID=A0ABS0BSW0_9GAMM|nr:MULTISPECIES: lipoprotein-releasing ABC transporter ATP-binding protein LolD [Thiomicrorhabdus]MBF6056928.1 lipoprotein-releasing ABC transporter ATP-binding protein LolD [Thiomicrorhabdus heinhorstiae]
MNDLLKVVLNAENLSKTYREGKIETQVFSGLNLQLFAGEKLAIVGTSGSGKSTLLHLLAGLDVPTSGKVELNGESFSKLNEVKRGRLRNQQMGFVYQFHHLLPELSAIENVMLPLKIRRSDFTLARDKAEKLLQRVGLSHRMLHKPSELSGGERQRVAIARALITEPACILADEPTGNLDEHSAEQVFQLLLELNQEMDTAILIVTHDMHLAGQMDRCLRLQESTLIEQ